MSDDKSKPVNLSAAEAAKLVKRPVPELDKAGQPTGGVIEKAVAAREVLAYSQRGDQVTVVTIDGQKLTGIVPAAKPGAKA